MKHPLRILIATPEAKPFAKTGGLADVVTSLARAIKKAGHHPSIIMPYYRLPEQNPVPELAVPDVPVPISNETETASIYRTRLEDDLPVYLVNKSEYFHRDYLYSTPEGDYADNARRFIFFSRAIIESLPLLGETFQVIHCNDWQTALIPLYIHHFKTSRKHLDTVKTLFTIHNLAYQGLFWRFDMQLTGLPWDYFTADGIEFYGDLNLMKAGIIYSDAINTVSEQYCRDIQTQEFGCGLDGILRVYADKLYGIVNGIDDTVWNPETDRFIAENYSLNDISGKKKCKTDLAGETALDVLPGKPLIGMISRLSTQKGLDILIQALPRLFEMGVYFVYLGDGDANYAERLSILARQHSRNFRFIHRFDEKLAHQIEAGCDMYLMPSKYEPCGLNQLYSLKYGTVPIVRHTGGLKDTIREYDAQRKSGNGFTFRDYSADALTTAVKRAIQFFEKPEEWTELMRSGMKEDHSWKVSAQKYIDLYEKILNPSSS